jgi:hypothetical protein
VLYCARTPNWLESREVKRISTLPSGTMSSVGGALETGEA